MDSDLSNSCNSVSPPNAECNSLGLFAVLDVAWKDSVALVRPVMRGHY
jgi:hypothetical protein